MKIKKQKLNLEQAKIVQEWIADTPNITGYTVKELLNFDLVFLCFVENNFAGVCIVAEISPRWSEIAVLIANPNYRNLGIGNQLFKQALEHIKSQNKNIYTVTRNLIVAKMCKEFDSVSFIKLPLNLIIYNIKFVFSLYRFKEFFRKKMYNYPAFEHFIKR